MAQAETAVLELAGRFGWPLVRILPATYVAAEEATWRHFAAAGRRLGRSGWRLLYAALHTLEALDWLDEDARAEELALMATRFAVTRA